MVSFVLLPNSPTTAWFLTKDEKAYVSDILHSEGILATADEQPTNFWHEARRIIVQPHAIMLAIAAMFVGTSCILSRAAHELTNRRFYWHKSRIVGLSITLL